MATIPSIRRYDGKTGERVDFKIAPLGDGTYSEVLELPTDLRPGEALCAKITCGVKDSVTTITLPSWAKYVMITKIAPVGIINVDANPGVEVPLSGPAIDSSAFGLGQYIWDAGSPTIRQPKIETTTFRILAFAGGDVYYVNIL